MSRLNALLLRRHIVIITSDWFYAVVNYTLDRVAHLRRLRSLVDPVFTTSRDITLQRDLTSSNAKNVCKNSRRGTSRWRRMRARGRAISPPTANALVALSASGGILSAGAYLVACHSGNERLWPSVRGDYRHTPNSRFVLSCSCHMNKEQVSIMSCYVLFKWTLDALLLLEGCVGELLLWKEMLLIGMWGNKEE